MEILDKIGVLHHSQGIKDLETKVDEDFKHAINSEGLKMG